jgi:hypothetical protein
MIHPPVRPLAAALAAAVLLTACSTSEPTGAGSSSGPSSPAPVSPTASTSASPASTLTAEEQQAVQEAAEAVRRYEQMFYDILSDPEPNLNDMNSVAAQPQLALDLKGLQEIFVAGQTTLDMAGPVAIASFTSEQVTLNDEPVVVLVVCVDRSMNSGTEAGRPWTGRRELARYRVEKAPYLPYPGWAVAKVQPPKGFDQPQPC